MHGKVWKTKSRKKKKNSGSDNVHESCRVLFIHSNTEAMKTTNRKKKTENIEILQGSKYEVKFNYPYEMCDVPGVQVEK